MINRRRLSRFATSVQPLECRQLLSSSLPGAEKTIYLDFDGGVTADTFWSFYTGGAPVVTPAFEGDAATIDRIWQRVSEDFAPFNVNVTTDGPGTAGNSVTVMIGGSAGDWFGSPAGGVAFVGTFGTSNGVAFVFPLNLGNGEKAVAEAISHEAGHTLGLSHDGDASGQYHVGHSIMGNSYYYEPSQWGKGEYDGANNFEDDVAIIASRLTFRADEATRELSGTVDVTGIISQSTDVDLFTFDTTGGPVNLNVTGAYATNLDVSVMLLDSTGSVVLVSNPGDRLDASLSGMLADGTYTVLIDGVGSASYTEYGSLGQYRVTGSVPGIEVIDHPPAISGVPVQTLVSTTNGTNPVSLMPSATFTDDSTSYAGYTLTVAIRGTWDKQSRLSLQRVGGVDARNQIFYGGVAVADYAPYGPASFTLRFLETATAASIQAVIQSIGFSTGRKGYAYAVDVTVTDTAGKSATASTVVTDVQPATTKPGKTKAAKPVKVKAGKRK